jgi:glycogen synthase
MFTVGPGNVADAYLDWRDEVRTLSETSRTFSSLCMDFIEGIGAECMMVSYNSEKKAIPDGKFTLINLPKPHFGSNRGISFHLNQVFYGLKLSRLAAREGVDFIVADSGTTHWFAWLVAWAHGIKVFPNFHNVYYPVTNPPKGVVRQLIKRLDSLFLANFTTAALGVSPECGRQYRSLAGNDKHFEGYFAQFSGEDFLRLQTADPKGNPFRILYVGRIEENKGVLDLVEVARLLVAGGHTFMMDVCGDGSAFQELASAIAKAQLGKLFQLHGRLKRPELLKVYEKAHAVVVPTRSTFTEGLPMVCAEAALAKRAIVTSKLSNALDVFGDAIIEAQPDDPRSFADALLRLMTDRDLLQKAGQQANHVAKLFLDPDRSLTAALHRLEAKGSF